MSTWTRSRSVRSGRRACAGVVRRRTTRRTPEANSSYRISSASRTLATSRQAPVHPSQPAPALASHRRASPVSRIRLARRISGRRPNAAAGDRRAQLVGPERHAGKRFDHAPPAARRAHTAIAVQHERRVTSVAHDQREHRPPERRRRLRAGRCPGSANPPSILAAKLLAPARPDSASSALSVWTPRHCAWPRVGGRASGNGAPAPVGRAGQPSGAQAARRAHRGQAPPRGRAAHAAARDAESLRSMRERASRIFFSILARSIDWPSPASARSQADAASAKRCCLKRRSPRCSCTTELLWQLRRRLRQRRVGLIEPALLEVGPAEADRGYDGLSGSIFSARCTSSTASSSRSPRSASM